VIHRLRWRVGSDAAPQFWSERLTRGGVEPRHDENDQRSLRSRDPDGLDLELAAVDSDDEPLVADAEANLGLTAGDLEQIEGSPG
jgi:glyoxalase family protein